MLKTLGGVVEAVMSCVVVGLGSDLVEFLMALGVTLTSLTDVGGVVSVSYNCSSCSICSR